MTVVNRINFGFPVNVTEEIHMDDIEAFKKKNFSQKNLHLKIHIDSKLGKKFNSETFKNSIKDAVKCENIKIDYIYNNEAVDRSHTISDAKTSVEKFKEYAKLTELEYNDSVLVKIDNIQNSMMINQFIPNDTFELEYMSLRGAIGVWEGQHKEEIEFNFCDGFSDGIILLCGPNGAGKTFCTEMMNPYNEHLSREGSLKNYFILKDSHKILIYRSSTGRKYKISMFIDGRSTSVMTIYKIEIMEPNSNVWTDGPEIKSADDYKKWVKSVFGPKDLFLRTAFFTTKQIKSVPDLSVAGKTEKMNLFSTLAGIDYLSVFHEQAKLHIKDEEKIIEEIKGQLKDFDNIDERLAEIGEQIVNNSQELDNYKRLIAIDNEELELCNEEQKKYLIAAGAFDYMQTSLKEKEIKIEDNERAVAKIDVHIESINEDLEDIELYREQIAWYEENTALLKKLNIEKIDLDKERESARSKYDKALSVNRGIEKEIDTLKNEDYKLDVRINAINKSLPDLNETCPVCGAPLSAHKKEELEKELKISKDELISCNKQKKEIAKSIENKQKEISDISELQSVYQNINNKYLEVSNDIISINEYASQLDIDKAKDIVNNATTKVNELNNRKSEILKENETLTVEIEELRIKLEEMPTDYSDKIARLNRGILDSQQQIATLTAEISALEREKNALNQNETLVKKIRKEIKEHQDNIKDYIIIRDSFSNTGIQAIELDSAAPEISDITNSILHSSYGERFTIKFETKRDTKDKKKTIDDFVIMVFDSRSGNWKVLEDLSQGEGLWIKQALYYSFSVIRARRTGFCFKTRFLDESDSPLDSTETRLLYLKMIEMAHQLSNASKTILITHSTEIKTMVDQKIILANY